MLTSETISRECQSSKTKTLTFPLFPYRLLRRGKNHPTFPPSLRQSPRIYQKELARLARAANSHSARIYESSDWLLLGCCVISVPAMSAREGGNWIEARRSNLAVLSLSTARRVYLHLDIEEERRSDCWRRILLTVRERERGGISSRDLRD